MDFKGVRNAAVINYEIACSMLIRQAWATHGQAKNNMPPNIQSVYSKLIVLFLNQNEEGTKKKPPQWSAQKIIF